MADSTHTWNATCHLSQSQPPEALKYDDNDDPIPPVNAQFFYTSSLPIDDPLSVIPIPSASADPSALPPQPFSGYDNAALEIAWRSFASSKASDIHRKSAYLSSKDGDSPRPAGKKSESTASVQNETHAEDEMGEIVKIAPLNKAKQKRFLKAVAGQTGTTGTPFQRAPSYKRVAELYTTSTHNRPALKSQVSEPTNTVTTPLEDTQQVLTCAAHIESKKQPEVEVLVGASRLHQVKLPSLQMLPIYWSPVHDEAAVIRGTWFYVETMLPVECVVANELESGYKELRPWSQTWSDELASALEHGALGEEKVVHKLWSTMEATVPKLDPNCAARCFHSEVAATGVTLAEKKRFPNSYVIYKDAKHAFILKPGLTPSEYYGRRPLSKIMKNMTIGIPVVRGYDRKLWNRLHPPKNTSVKAQVKTRNGSGKDKPCPACHFERSRPIVSDLVLVVHGIGQKLSERVESFHFTHAVNSFRRAINVELVNDGVRQVLRPDLGGLMVLPINWRAHLPAEAGGTAAKSISNAEDGTIATLDDITLKTIPAVRSLISDVLLDLPYYMSKHKPAMVKALITEANLVYNSWCVHNPGFHENGRVHIIAHSLGSVMAMEVLSQQPTTAPDFQPKAQCVESVEKQYFQFDTTNLFSAGSPAALFLHLEGASLLPRRRLKPDADIVDEAIKNITGQAGTYGCMAVDNLYNICHYDDPVSYLLNPRADVSYAKSIKPAEIPSSHAGWLDTITSALRGTSAVEPVVGQLIAKPLVMRQPSQLEMDVHDFTREELAEKKFYLLNDNGQIDYYLPSAGGPFDVAYLNMIGAHSSYWTSQDFIRMIVTEIGREPGKTNTMPNMRAAKVEHKKRGKPLI